MFPVGTRYWMMLNECKGMERGPFLFEFSKRHQTYAMRKAETFRNKLGELQRTACAGRDAADAGRRTGTSAK